MARLGGLGIITLVDLFPAPAQGIEKGSKKGPKAALEVGRVRRYGRRAIRPFRGKTTRNSSNRRDVRHVRRIYKICPASAWREAERQGVYRGSADDARDGFIHFSLPSQVAETARKHFAGQTGLFLIAVDADALGDALRFEPSRNDELFPHLYGELDLGAVIDVKEMHARSDGFHDVPELEP
jgi:uncharacterized protein (DUF952 family)